MTISPLLGDRCFASLRPVDARLLIEDGNKRGVAQGRSAVITFRRILRYAKDCGIKLPCDVEDVEIPTPKRLRDMETLTPAEVCEIRRVLDEHSVTFSKHLPVQDREKHAFCMIRTKCMFEFLLRTGLRLSEALSVDRTQIDFVSNELRVLDVKSNRFDSERRWKTVYIHGAEEALREYLRLRNDRDRALFIVWGGRRLNYTAAQSNLKRVKKLVGLKKNLNHKIFRATFITTLLRSGMDPKEVQRLARHRSLHMTLNYYYQLDDAALKPKHAAIMASTFNDVPRTSTVLAQQHMFGRVR